TISNIEANAFNGLTSNTIDYLGSIEEFKTIQKKINWNSTLDASYIEIVKCYDGNVYFDRYGNLLTENEQPEEQPEEKDNVLRLVYNDGTTYEQQLESEILDALTLRQINNISNCTEITIPDCVVIFKNNIYGDEFINLKTINIGKNLSSFTSGLLATFGGIEGAQSENKLEKINVDENNEHLIVIDDVLFSKDLTVLYCYPGQKTDIKYNVPSGVTKIGDYAFISNHYLQEVVLPDTVIELEFECFMDCQNLYVVKTNDSIQNINVGAFMECYNLTTLNLSSELKKIGNNAFSFCENLNYITYEGSIYACQLTEVSCDSMMGYGGPKGTLTFECTNGTYSFKPGE
ncbi:MAG: leucine-rich repeat domain-containing protein, partial [Christensenellales bacterium]